LLKSVRAGIAVALLFTSFGTAAGLLLNPRFIDHFELGAILLWVVPVLGGAAAGAGVGSVLKRLAHLGSSEDPVRALELLWAAFTGFVAFFGTLALLPPFLGVFSNSETIRYGGALVLAGALSALGVLTARSVAHRFRFWIWPLLLALPVAAVLAGATDWGRGKGQGSRVLVLAAPGLSWNVAEDMIERGDMPNFAALRARGAWGELQSVSQPLTPMVWTTIATGKTSAEHGVVGFSSTAEDVKSLRIWDIFQQRGWTVGLFGWPVTWPPEEVSGFMVPAVSDVGTETWPRELNFIRELAMSEKTRRQRTWGRYCRYAFLGIRYGVRLSTLIEAGQEILTDPFRGHSLDSAQLFTKRKLRAKLNSDTFVELRRQHPVDFAAFYTNVVDVAQSYFWQYHEPQSFPDISPKDISRYGESVHDSYRMVDEFLGKILADTGDNDVVLVISDHGAEARVESSREQLTLRVESMLREMRLQGVIEATNLGPRTYLRTKPGHESSRERVQRLFETARLGSGARAFLSHVDDWGNVVVTVNPDVLDHMSEILLYQGGRCPVSDVVRTVDFRESAQRKATGAIVFAGKGIAPGASFGRVQLVDVVPTLLVLSGLDLAADLPGDVTYGALEPSAKNRFPGVVATYEPQP
jgi:Type I phosphodiesterase / nucleotide pyrophosphatase